MQGVPDIAVSPAIILGFSWFNNAAFSFLPTAAGNCSWLFHLSEQWPSGCVSSGMLIGFRCLWAHSIVDSSSLPSSFCCSTSMQNIIEMFNLASALHFFLGGSGVRCFSFCTTSPTSCCQSFSSHTAINCGLYGWFYITFKANCSSDVIFVLAESFTEGILQISPLKMSFGRRLLNIPVLLRKSLRLSYLSHQLFLFPVKDFLRFSGWMWLASQLRAQHLRIYWKSLKAVVLLHDVLVTWKVKVHWDVKGCDSYSVLVLTNLSGVVYLRSCLHHYKCPSKCWDSSFLKGHACNYFTVKCM